MSEWFLTILINKIIISEPDRELIPHPDRDKVVVVANGVDTDFFSPAERTKKLRPGLYGKYGLSSEQ